MGLQGMQSLVEVQDMQFLFNNVEETETVSVFLLEGCFAQSTRELDV